MAALPLPLQRFSTLQWALALSVLFHALLLTLRFVAPEAMDRVLRDSPLEVILVNARSETPPERATAIAQASLAGGGDAEQGRASSPLPAATVARLGDAVIDQDEQLLESLKQQQNRLLAQVRQQLASLPPPDPGENTQNPAVAERERRRQALIQTLAEIERRIQEENARPRKRFISPATREGPQAVYYDNLRRLIEEHGTRHYPEVGGRKLYGELTMVITVNHTGEVLATEVVQGSGKPALDRRAEAIVRDLKYGRFDEALRRFADQLVVVTRFRFSREDGVQAEMSSRQP